MKVLLSAYACEPGRGSEPGIGWNVAREIANYHQVWVLTSNTHRPLIEDELKHNSISNLNFVYLDPFNWVYDWEYEGKRPHWDVHLHYYLWQILAYFVAKPLHQQIGFDIVHHVTYVKYSSPSFLSFLSAPFLWGPVGGGESAPRTFYQDLSLRGKLYETARTFARRLGELDPFVRLTAGHNSSLTLATTEETAQRLRAIGAKNVQIFSQVGLPQDEIAHLAQYATQEISVPRFISIGRLLHWKGFHLGLEAFAQADLPNTEYWIVGDGPEKERLQKLAEELGISKRVKFWYKLPRQETLEKLASCLALVHPSLHESGGLVCLEAMAASKPVICFNLGGPGIQVTEETGFKIPAHSAEQAIDEIAIAMTRLVKEPDMRLLMGEAARKRVCEVYNWQIKGKYFTQIYDTLAPK